ncbi:MAG: hypothetical protein NT039_04560, partial [Candidatus Berkelbacteria bacterium]|nr:hypothetical protein [Candidatus Berkelbacteria bacterium]
LKKIFQFLTPKVKAEETTTTTESTTTTETTSTTLPEESTTTTTTLPSETTTITEPTTTTPVTSSLIFSNFDLGKDFFNQIIPQNIQLRFSLAGQGQEGDKILISYLYSASAEASADRQWQNLEELNLSQAVSNNTNGGYFLYALPVFENWTDLENLKIRFSVISCGEAQNSCGLVFLDAVWLEVEYQSGEEKEIAFVDPRTNFSSDEEPEFILPLITERDNNTLLDKIRELLFQPQIQIKEAILIGPDNQKITPELILNKENESYKIRIKKPENFQSGKYFFEIQFEWADQIYTAKTEFNWEEIIIFNPVLSPDFSNSATKQDVEENGIRVVIIERGGLMELWYAIPDKDKPDAMNWFFLAGHSQIDNDSPLGLKGKTIFWLDKNEQTIFGYAIDEQSIFGKSVETEGKESYLEFQNKNLGSWRAVFDPINNKFNFLKSLGENQ